MTFLDSDLKRPPPHWDFSPHIRMGHDEARWSVIELLRRRKRPAKPYPSQRYGAAHRAMRMRLEPVVATGEIACARCGQMIGQGEEWQLDHRDDGRGWLGPSHRRCNAKAGWESMVASVSGNGSGRVFEEMPYRWSQRWHDDPPIGTIVLGHERVIYLGNGVWQALDDTPND
jgi:hypothetical protein